MIMGVFSFGLLPWLEFGVDAVQWGPLVAALSAGISGLLARDNDKSSEDVGATS